MLKRLEGLLKLGHQKPLYFDTLRNHPPLSFKPSNGNAVKKIEYPEDGLRARYYRRNPLELDRPLSREDSGDCDGEWVIERQLQLMEEKPGLSSEAAYEQATGEYKARQMETGIKERLEGKMEKSNEEFIRLLDEVFLEEKRSLQVQRQAERK